LIVGRKAIVSDELPPAVGPFALGVHCGQLLYLSGQVAQDRATGALIDGDVAHQTDRILRNIATSLQAAGKDLDDVVRVGVYLTDMADFAAMNEVYRRYFAEPYPARTTIGVAALPLGAMVEMDVVANLAGD
jgi:2-iminobutanoate/2-iminopropanoate deaminase